MRAKEVNQSKESLMCFSNLFKHIWYLHVFSYFFLLVAKTLFYPYFFFFFFTVISEQKRILASLKFLRKTPKPTR